MNSTFFQPICKIFGTIEKVVGGVTKGMLEEEMIYD